MRLERDDGYFYFWTGEATGSLDNTVRVQTVGSLTLEQWVGKFQRLKKLNATSLTRHERKTD